MEIAQQNGCLRAGNYQYEKHQEEESKHIVHLIRPQRTQNEEQLDEDAAKWQNAAHYDAGNWLCVN